MKQYIVLIVVVIVVVGAFMFTSWRNKAQADVAPYAPANTTAPQVSNSQIEVTNTDVGTMYIDKNSIQTVKKDNAFYLVVAAEEVYTDTEFLQSLHQDESTQNVTACSYLYMFSSDGRYYATVKRYLTDNKDMVCADLGGSTQMQAMSGNPVVVKIYTTALKILDNK